MNAYTPGAVQELVYVVHDQIGRLIADSKARSLPEWRRRQAAEDVFRLRDALAKLKGGGS